VQAIVVRVMFDTSIFTNLFNGNIALSLIPVDWQPIATQIQWEEIQSITHPSKCPGIESIFYFDEAWAVAKTSERSDVSRLQRARLPKTTSLYGCLRVRMDELKQHPHNLKDALMADTCSQKAYLMVTNDRTLIRIAREFSINAIGLASS